MAAPPTLIPLRGTLGAQDAQNPQLLPLMDRSSSSGAGGTLDHMTPSQYLTAFPRTSGSATITIGGSITNLDTTTLTFTGGIFSGGSYTTAAYTIVTADTTATVMSKTIDAINNDSVLATSGISAEPVGTGSPLVLTVNASGPAANGVVITANRTGASTTTYTVSGALAGGSGPIIPTANFSFSYNGCQLNFLYGQPVNVGSDLLAVLIAQDRPII
jgi:hypothetical protein